MRYLEILGGLLQYPEKYVRIVIHEDRPILEALFSVAFFQGMYCLLSTVIIINLVNSIFTLFSTNFLPGIFEIAQSVVSLFLPVLVPLGILAGLILWFIWALITHLTARLLGGIGDLMNLLKVMGFSWFTLDAAILPLLFYPISPFASIVGSIFFLPITFLWMLFINYHSVKEIYGLSSGKAILSLLALPLIIILVSVVSTFILSFFALGGVV